MDDDITTVHLVAVVRPNQVQELEETIVRMESERAHSRARWKMVTALEKRLRSGEIDYPTYARLRDQVRKRPAEELLTFPADWSGEGEEEEGT
jgi:hypothetical protein